MSRMISDLLDYTRTRLGAGMPVSREPIDLRAVCADVVAEFRSANPAVNIEFHAAGDTMGRWDAARLRQVVSNLLGNAVQYGTLGSPVTVTLDGDPSGVTLAVANQGNPIPAQELRTIFDPLVRGGAAVALGHKVTGSIGLGLYIVRQLVVAHGGSIDVTSSKAGTVFTSRLPRDADTASIRP